MRYAAVRMAAFRYAPAAPRVPVGDVDTLPRSLTRREQVLRGVFTSLQKSRRGGLGVRQWA